MTSEKSFLKLYTEASAQWIKSNPNTTSPTYIKTYSRVLCTCISCGSEEARHCSLVINNIHYGVGKLCDRRVSAYRRLQRIIITQPVIDRRVRILSCQYNTLIGQFYTRLICILCCERDGEYQHTNNTQICSKCKMRGMKMLCVEVLLMSNHMLLRDIQMKIVMMIWNIAMI